MSYRFHEVRKGECERVIAFAAEHGCEIPAKALRHPLSLLVEDGERAVAAALCVEREPGQFVIEIVVGGGEENQSLLTELADRCLRKVQAQAIASARLHSPGDGSTDAIWSRTNWLEQVEETPPPEQEPSVDEPSQAA